MQYQIYTYDALVGWSTDFANSELARFDSLEEAEQHADELSNIFSCVMGVFDVSDGGEWLVYRTSDKDEDCEE